MFYKTFFKCLVLSTLGSLTDAAQYRKRNQHIITSTSLPWLPTKHQDNHYQFTTPQYSIETTVNKNLIKTEIKSILNVKTGNTTIDNYILNFFNTDNPDPLYIFVLPDNTKNRTIVLRKSNFNPATFPNISLIDKRIQSHQLNFKSQSLITPSESKRIQRSKLKEEFDLDSHATNDDETKYVEIVAENVRTEKNFFQFMNKLNNEKVTTNDVKIDAPSAASYKQNLQPTDNLLDIDHIFHTGYQLPLETSGDGYFYQRPKKTKQKVSWKDLGLNGWSGRLSRPDLNFRKGKSFLPASETTEYYDFSTTDYTLEQITGKPQFYVTKVHHRRPQKNLRYIHTTPYYRPDVGLPPTLYSNQFDHIHANLYTPFPERPRVVHYPEKSLPSSTPISIPENNIDSWEVEMKIPDVLTRIITEENNKLLHSANNNNNSVGGGATTFNSDSNNDGKRTAKPVWPVTSSRESHRDEDVFIARANNPFGHSTKWTTSNTSSSMASSPPSSSDTDVDYENRSKRGALELYSMVKCSTGCDPLIYKGYGCYCGFLGAGRTLDGIDRCCKMHDYCYETANCPMFLEYFVPYLWKCYRGQPLCAIDHGEWGGPGSCASRLCECDQALSKCLRRFYCPRKRAVCTTSPLRLLQNVIMEPFSL